MSEIVTGGPAFPIECHIAGGYRADEGLTMRDYFAGQALPAACTIAFHNASQATDMQLLPEEWAARIAYGMADAMLARKFATDPKPRAYDADDDRPF